MSVKIRLTRMGTHKRPFYRVVVTDSRTKRGGQYIENVGTYDPLMAAEGVKLDQAKIVGWLDKGAIPTVTVKQLLKKAGIAKTAAAPAA
ncbi:MAG: 30S ribosomal protein S16 [Nitrospirota bacterium]|nr:30S ribosomal protein S16 [Nitrospirota bacterium]